MVYGNGVGYLRGDGDPEDITTHCIRLSLTAKQKNTSEDSRVRSTVYDVSSVVVLKIVSVSSGNLELCNEAGLLDDRREGDIICARCVRVCGYPDDVVSRFM